MKRKFDSELVEPPSKKRIFTPGTVYKKMNVEGRKPFDQWFAGLSPDKQADWVKKEALRRNTKKTTKRKRQAKKYTASKRGRYSGGGGGGSGTNIIYPNVVGRGEYYLGGGFGYDPKEGWYGHAKGHITDTVQGLGAYNVRHNSLMSAIDLGQDPPRVANTNRGEATVFNHREYIGDLRSGSVIEGPTTEFTLSRYELNPGNSALFPFLHGMAWQFQEYEIRGMLVELKSLASDYSSNLSLGSYFMAADYNVYGNDPITKQQVENMEYASSSKPSRSMIMPIECDPSNNGAIHKNVAIDGEYAGGDKRLYDWANLYIGSQGNPEPNAPLAEIWITYEIAFFKPILTGNSPAHSQAHWDAVEYKGVGVADNFPMGTTVIPTTGNSEGYTTVLDESGSFVVNFPKLTHAAKPIHYLVTYIASGFNVNITDNVLPTISPTGALSWTASMTLNSVNESSGQTFAGLSTGEHQMITVGILKYFAVEPVWQGSLSLKEGVFTTGTVRSQLIITALPASLEV